MLGRAACCNFLALAGRNAAAPAGASAMRKAMAATTALRAGIGGSSPAAKCAKGIFAFKAKQDQGASSRDSTAGNAASG